MPYLLIRHKVEDYERWKPVFDEHGAVREQSGSKGGRLWRNADDPNETIILFEWDSLENAQRFANSDDLRETMQRAGVADHPDDPKEFDAYFYERHLPLTEEVTQIRRREVAKIMGAPDGTQASYYVISEYYFETMDDLQGAFTSEAGGRLNEDLANFAGAGVSVFVSQISE